MRLTFEKNTLPSVTWWALPNQLKALREKRLTFHPKGNSASRLPLDLSFNINSSLGRQAYGSALQTLDLPAYTIS